MNWNEAAMIMFSCVMANYLGLISAVEQIIHRSLPIVNCPKCFTFWSVLAYMMLGVGFSDIPKSVPDSFPNLSQTVPDTESEDSLELEITQKVYSDSTYTAYVSGYEPRLDSIFVRQKVITNTIHETRTIKEKKFRRWNVGLIGGYGYGFKSQTFEPFIGVGVTISLF